MTSPPLAAAALLSAVLAWRHPSARQVTISATLCGLLAINLGRPLLTAWPSLYLAGFVAWYAVTAWGVSFALAPEEPRAEQAFAVLAAASGIAVSHGAEDDLGRAAFALALAAQTLAAFRFALRGKRADAAQRVALILALSSLADAFGPWLFAAPDRDWSLGRWISVVTWGLISGVNLWTLLRRRTES